MSTGLRYRINAQWSAERLPDGGVLFTKWDAGQPREMLSLRPEEWLDLSFAVSVWSRDGWRTRAMLRNLIERVHMGDRVPER